MYKILIFVNYAWMGESDDQTFDCLEDALAFIRDTSLTVPWRIEEWIDIRNGPAEAGFWHDVEWWISGSQFRSTTEVIS